MEAGKRYIVTKASDDGTFEAGDHITVESDGSVSCQEACGWIDAIYIAEATKGMEVEIDSEWINKKKAKLLEELAALANV